MSLIELALLTEDRKTKARIDTDLLQFFARLQASPSFIILPITYEIASEIMYLRPLRDPADRAIVATARVHRLRLLTSDRRIIESNLIPVVA
jgi:PIN domain nuclease of toxin-antitoxin system